MQVNIPALDKAQRRKANRKARRQGLDINLDAIQRKAVADTSLRCNLSYMTDPAARKAKRKLNDVWSNRNSRNLDGFWKPTEE